MPNNNVVCCSKCGVFLINEELEIHECFVFKDFWIIDEKIWIGNGKKYYRWIQPKNKHPEFTPDDSTEPNFTLCYVTFYRKPSIMI